MAEKITFPPKRGWRSDRRTKYLKKRCSNIRGMCTEKKWSSISIRYLNVVDGITDIRTDRRMDIYIYIVGSLLKSTLKKKNTLWNTIHVLGELKYRIWYHIINYFYLLLTFIFYTRYLFFLFFLSLSLLIKHDLGLCRCCERHINLCYMS